MSVNLKITMDSNTVHRVIKDNTSVVPDCVMSTRARRSGKWIWGFKINTTVTSNQNMFGICPGSFNAQTTNQNWWSTGQGGYAWYGNDGNIYWDPGGSMAYGTPFGAITGFCAVDLDLNAAGKIWFGRASGATIAWEAGGDPEAGTGAPAVGPLHRHAGGYYPVQGLYRPAQHDQQFLLTADDLAAYTLPAGFQPWGVKRSVPNPTTLSPATIAKPCVDQNGDLVTATGLRGRLSADAQLLDSIDWEGTFDASAGVMSNFDPPLGSGESTPGSYTQWFEWTDSDGTAHTQGKRYFSGPVSVSVS